MKNKIHTLLFIGFFCVLLYSVLYFIKEGFTENDSYGQWELLLRQSYNEQFTKSPFGGTGTSVNLDALYDYNGKITEPNYYNHKLLSSYDFSSNIIFKLNIYDLYEDTSPSSTMTWSQQFSSHLPVGVVNRGTTSTFKGIEKGTTTDFVFKQAGEDNYILGASTEYLGDNKIPGTSEDTFVEKTELYLWNPRPKNKNTFNGDFSKWEIQKVDMDKTAHKLFWNKSEGISGEIDEEDARYSYCFGKLRCNDNTYSPIKNTNGTYKPYCNSDASNNPVYCEGSFLYNTDSASLKNVSMGTLSYDMMGKYASYKDLSNSSRFNLFRGLTTPYEKDYIDPEISGNDIIINENNNKSTFHICDFLDNQNLDNGTNLQEECQAERKSIKKNGKNCIADFGDTIDSKYANYVCEKNERCIGYNCGSNFGSCTPTLL